MVVSFFRLAGPTPFLPTEKERLNEGIRSVDGFYEFFQCALFARNIHYVGFLDPAISDCVSEFSHVISAKIYGDQNSIDHILQKRRCTVDISGYPWEFKQSYIEKLKAEKRIHN